MKPVFVLVITLLLFALPGCYMQTWISGPVTENKPNDETPALDTLRAAPENDIAIEQPITNDIIDKLSIIEKLDSTAQLLDIATSHLETAQLTQAGYYFALAKVMLSSVDTDEIDEYSGYYNDLVTEINCFFANYVEGVDELPKESPVEVIFAGIEEAERDSALGETDSSGIEPDSVQIEIEEFTRPEVEVDSTELTRILHSIESLPGVPLITNRRVENAVKFFQNKGRKVFNKWMERGGYYIPIIKPILVEEGLPEELVFLAMIESGFNPKAYSYAHAVGPWQFIASTGHIFGLEVGWWYDERRDPVLSTRAAAKYLKKLYAEFDDWYLALAAYNCGEGKVRKHVRRYGTRDFWQLKHLPKQTRNYVPTYIAAAQIALNPTEYGFEEFNFLPVQLIDSVIVSECIDLELVAEIAGTDYSQITKLNPAIVRWCTPPDKDKVWLRLPKGIDLDSFNEKLDNLPAEQKRKWVRHKVRSGETLSTIADKYKTTMRAICDVKDNNIRNLHRIKAGNVLYIPVPPKRYNNFPPPAYDEYTPPPDREKIVYTVRRGDNLSTIAERYGTSASALRKWNKLYSKRFIYPGQKLTIWTKPEYSSGRSREIRTKHTGLLPAQHIVKRGETAWDIARHYRVSLEDLLSLNDMNRRSVIKPGEMLNLPATGETEPVLPKPEIASAQLTGESHTVKRGENLSWIASKHGTTVETLKELNGINNVNRLKPGDVIILPEMFDKPEPVKNPATQLYTVRKGDTLWDIARKYDVSILEIKTLNDISDHRKIKPGDEIIIPPN